MRLNFAISRNGGWFCVLILAVNLSYVFGFGYEFVGVFGLPFTGNVLEDMKFKCIIIVARIEVRCNEAGLKAGKR